MFFEINICIVVVFVIFCNNKKSSKNVLNVYVVINGKCIIGNMWFKLRILIKFRIISISFVYVMMDREFKILKVE